MLTFAFFAGRYPPNSNYTFAIRTQTKSPPFHIYSSITAFVYEHALYVNGTGEGSLSGKHT